MIDWFESFLQEMLSETETRGYRTEFVDIKTASVTIAFKTLLSK